MLRSAHAPNVAETTTGEWSLHRPVIVQGVGVKNTTRTAAFAVAAGVCLAGPAEASVEVKVKTTTYRITGENGEGLLRAIDRKGSQRTSLLRLTTRSRGRSTGNERRARAVLPMLRRC